MSISQQPSSKRGSCERQQGAAAKSRPKQSRHDTERERAAAWLTSYLTFLGFANVTRSDEK